MRKGELRCIVCNRVRDPETGLCPTPDACARLKQPHKRAADEQRALAARERRADRERIGVGRVKSPEGIPDGDWRKVGVG